MTVLHMLHSPVLCLRYKPLPAAFGSLHQVASLETLCISVTCSLNSSLILSKAVCRKAPQELLIWVFHALLPAEMFKLTLYKENSDKQSDDGIRAALTGAT